LEIAESCNLPKDEALQNIKSGAFSKAADMALLQNYSEGMEMAFSGNFYAAIGNRSSMN
jgi:hypothetical protein